MVTNIHEYVYYFIIVHGGSICDMIVLFYFFSFFNQH